MTLQDAQATFIHRLKNIYDTQEAINLFRIAWAHSTGDGYSLLFDKTVLCTATTQYKMNSIVERLLTYEPIQYIVAEAWFYDSAFYVNKNVLIPRPETEELVDWILKDNKAEKAITIVDVGTGSGCIPIILKKKLPQAIVHSCDVSRGALQVARKNAAYHHTDIHFLQLDILHTAQWKQLPKTDIIVSNPPYIPQQEKQTMALNVVQHEPATALFVPDEQSIIFYEAIATAGLQLLNDEGSVYVEIHENFAAAVAHAFECNGYTTQLKNDMQGKNRMIKARLPLK